MDGPRHGEQNHSVLNDLDLRLENDEGNVALPWAMPEAQTFLDNLSDLSLQEVFTAVRQTNHTDNVELLEIDALATFTASLFSTTVLNPNPTPSRGRK